MKERPIIMQAESVRAILEGRKTQTRRVVAEEICSIYSLTDERAQCIHTQSPKGIENVESCAEGNPLFSELGLHGWERWENLLKDAVRWLWEKGARGLVCVNRPRFDKGVPMCFFVPQKQESDKIRSQACVHGISRDALNTIHAGSPLERKQAGQQAGKPIVGHSRGKLDGQKSAREWNEWIATSNVKIIRDGAGAYSVCSRKRIMQPAPCGKGDGYESICYLSAMPYKIGQKLWVKEAWCQDGRDGTDAQGRDAVYYKASVPYGVWPESWQSPIYMPRWASRITLELVNVRVERVQDISRQDAKAEGFWPSPHNGLEMFDGLLYGNSQLAYKACWQSIHRKNPARCWEANPWAWVLEFKKETT